MTEPERDYACVYLTASGTSHGDVHAEGTETSSRLMVGMKQPSESGLSNDGLIRDGKAAPSGEPALASAGISAAVRKGTPKPDISSPDALKRTLLAATSISYVNPASGGASSIHFVKVLDRLGIATEMKSKTVFSHSNTPAEVGALVASGVAELGVHVIVELIPVVGIDVIGPLPGDLQNNIVFSAAVIADTREPEAAKALVAFLCRPEAASVMRAKGLEPAIR